MAAINASTTEIDDAKDTAPFDQNLVPRYEGFGGVVATTLRTVDLENDKTGSIRSAVASMSVSLSPGFGPSQHLRSPQRVTLHQREEELPSSSSSSSTSSFLTRTNPSGAFSSLSVQEKSAGRFGIEAICQLCIICSYIHRFEYGVGKTSGSSYEDIALAAISKTLECLNMSGGSTATISVPGLGCFNRVCIQDDRPGKVTAGYEFYQGADGRFFNVKLFRYLSFDLVKLSPRMVIMTNVIYNYTDSDGIVIKFIVISIMVTNCVANWQKK